ncbi:hypothetical protein GXB78_27585 [Pseudomonas moraviensis subsp. stanleyae]|uniref:hypothetical protein n=1 Tax=Pseudomonas moraviensis TaxID=321662 RepID=UPI002E33192A|nr:hypothetical protein [Pseudomonas moraviensis]MED7670970.1 hypothetical protein [Pseudomonas moraviensis subsp. stanleyae]
MSKLLRLSESEQEAIRLKAIEINKLLVKRGLPPLKDSELTHKILELSISYTRLNAEGELFLDLYDLESADNCTKVGV